MSSLNSTTIKVFHGTSVDFANNIQTYGVDLTRGRKNIDFGQGFYVTENQWMAMAWAVSHHNVPAVLEFELNVDDLKIKRFSLNNEWAEEIYRQRIKEDDRLNDVDLVLGPIADGQMSKITKQVLKYEISKDQFLERIIPCQKNAQIVLKSPKAINHLTCLGIKELNENEITE